MAHVLGSMINKGDGSYQFNWKTPTSYAKSCKTLKLDPGDGGSGEYRAVRVQEVSSLAAVIAPGRLDTIPDIPRAHRRLYVPGSSMVQTCTRHPNDLSAAQNRLDRHRTAPGARSGTR